MASIKDHAQKAGVTEKQSIYPNDMNSVFGDRHGKKLDKQ